MTVSVVSTVELNESSSATTRNLTMPTVQDGDAALLCLAVATGSTTFTATTSGLTWTAVASAVTASGITSQLWYIQNLASTDSAKTVAVGTSASMKIAGGLVVLRGVATTGLINAVQTKNAGSTTTPTTPSVTGTAPGAAVFTFVGQSRGGTTPNTTTADPNSGQGVTEVFDAFTTGTASLSSCCAGIDVSGLDNGEAYPARTFTFEQSAQYTAWAVVLKPGNVAPIVDAGQTQEVLSGDTVNLSGTASDPDGSISGVEWTIEEYPEHYLDDPPEITNDTSLTTASFDTTAPGKYVVRLTATDNSSATAYDDVTIWVCTTTARVYAVHTAGGWTQYGAGDDIPATLKDGSDTTGAQSPNNPSNSATVYYLDPMPVGSKTVSGRVNLDGSGTGSVTLTLKMGNGTTVSTDTVTGLTGTTPIAFSFPLSTGENGTVTDPHEMTITAAATASA